MKATKTNYPPKQKPLLVFDGDCGLCRYWLVKWKKVSGNEFDFEPFQKVSANFSDIEQDQFRKAVQLILTNGEVMQGAEVAYYTYYINGSLPVLYRLYKINKLFRLMSDKIYNWIASNRNFAFKLSKIIFGKDPYRSSKARLVIILILFLTLISAGIANI